MRNRAADDGRRGAAPPWRAPAGLDLELLHVPAGPAPLGRDDGAPDERPRHAQAVDALWVARAPVTRRAWRAFALATGRPTPPRPWWAWEAWGAWDEAPATGVSWADAAAFCGWAGLALPTEAEWARAATAAGPAPPPLLEAIPWCPGATAFPFAAAAARLAEPRADLVVVDGLREWCADWYSPRAYLAYAAGDLTPPAAGARRVVRGWAGGAPGPRGSLPPDRAAADVGLRPVLRPPGSAEEVP